MMKNIPIFIFLFYCTHIFSQSITPERKSCLNTRVNSPFYSNISHPGDDEFEQKISLLLYENSHQRTKEEVMQIPVIVHVIHNDDSLGTGANIAYEQVLSQIKILNEDFRRKVNTPGFNDHTAGADAKIEFVLALRDPNESPLAEPGVHRFSTDKEHYTANEFQMAVKPITIWDPTKYLNIWTTTFGGSDANTLGYAQFPNVPSDVEGIDGLDPIGGMATTDGVVIGYHYFGDTLNVRAPYNLGRTATHEVGHWLGLIHIWGDGDCDDDDYCNDTPLADGYNEMCVINNSCIEAENDQNDMIENYMDYTPDACMNIFTNDQKARMRIVMMNSIRRKELLNSEKHIPLTVPMANFEADSTNLDINTYITFNDSTLNSPSNWIWSFEGGSPSTSLAQNPRVQYREYGNFDVTLIVSNAVGADTIVRENHISVARVTSLTKELNALRVYPNPALNTIYVDFGKQIGEKKIEIFDLKGVKVFHQKTTESSLNVTLEKYQSGLYIIKVDNGTSFEIFKILKE
ncbi:M43 family zinc metalloprotease [Flammeovirga pacifica]|uniref:PKD domain-containing protein n=1 Tax=Flammeovirga pacifica TaxID=915059 RepID=A0A1S1YSP7_FLAPC|nr:M43 family zinc metalloprotease [Flammeovirga pacifica]OHX64054.1 hypothetical protein NH26_20815 [Flammeovirga pacifica]